MAEVERDEQEHTEDAVGSRRLEVLHNDLDLAGTVFKAALVDVFEAWVEAFVVDRSRGGLDFLKQCFLLEDFQNGIFVHEGVKLHNTPNDFV